MRSFRLFGVFAVLAWTCSLHAQPQLRNYEKMDYGPFINATYAIQAPKNNTVYRGCAVGFDVPADAKTVTLAKTGFIFDMELLRPAAFWTVPTPKPADPSTDPKDPKKKPKTEPITFVRMEGVVFSGSHGANPSPNGNLLVVTRPTPGWAKDGTWKDPREFGYGPLPRDWARYKGLYRSDDGIVFVYTVGDAVVHEMPSVDNVEGHKVLTRNLNIKASAKPLTMVVADVEGGKGKVEDGIAILEKGDVVTAARVQGVDGAAFEILDGDRIVLKLPALKAEAKLKVSVWSGPKADQAKATAGLAKLAAPIDLASFMKGGKARWTESIVTKGVVGEAPKVDPKKKTSNVFQTAYVSDSITPPFKNPYDSWMRIGGFDFFSDGRAAVSTWSGDVWIVSGIDDKLDKVTWKRYAAGLFQGLGLKIVDDKVYVLGRDGITRLHDLNGDGEADFYECFNNDFQVTANFHEFIFDLHTDPEGNFYFIKGGPVRPGGSGWDKLVPHHGCIFRLSSDGSKLDVVARGFRAPNGMGVGPKGEITCGDNQGTWTPVCPLNWVKEGGFYGVPEFSYEAWKKEKLPTVRTNPLCWLPMNVDNSNGGQAWIDSDKFGPLSGQLLHCSYGQSTLYLVLKELVDGQMQGGVTPLMRFDSGTCRMRWVKNQNALFLTGLRGWQTNASQDAGFYRLRYTGTPLNLPIDLHVEKDAIKISFSDAVDKAQATDPQNFRIEQWNYKWTGGYGSPEIKVSNPKMNGHDELEAESASLSADGKTVTLKVEGLRPVMQMKIGINIKAADGTPIRAPIYNTINVVGDQVGEVHPGEYKLVPRKQ